MPARLLLAVCIIMGSIGVGLTAASLAWASLNAWERHNQQHLLIDDRILPAVSALWRECQQRGKCQ